MFVKSAFINQAKIEVVVSDHWITAFLKGLLPSGREAEFGKCELMMIG